MNKAPKQRSVPTNKQGYILPLQVRGVDYFGLLFSIAVPLLLYIPTFSRSLLLEDDGLFLGVGAHLGTAHPPGYPLYTMLLWLFMKLPFATPALAGHFFSALIGAFGCGALYICARQIRLSFIAAFVAALLFGVQEHVWSQAIRAEVYSLNYLLSFATLAVVLQVRSSPHMRGFWVLGGLLTGLALSHHWPLFVLAGPAFLVLLWPARSYVLKNVIPFTAVCLLTIAALYGWMVWRSLLDPMISFSGPINGWDEFWDYFLRKEFSGIDNSESAGWPDRLQYFGWFFEQAFTTFTPLGGLLTLIGIWAITRSDKITSLALLLLWAGQGVLLLLLLNFDYDFFNVAVFRVYSLVAYGVQAIWIVLGVAGLLSVLPAKFFDKFANGKEYIAAAFGAAMLASIVPHSMATNNQSQFTFPQDFATYVLNKVEPNSVILVEGDFTTATFAYYQHVENIRPDVDIFHTSGLAINDGPFANVRNATKRKKAVDGLLAQGRPIYTFAVSQAKTLCPSCGLQGDGLIVRLRLDIPNQVIVSWQAEDEAFVEKLINLSSNDAWVQTIRKTRLLEFGRIATRVIAQAGQDNLTIHHHFANPKTAPWVQLGAIREVLENWDAASLPAVLQWLEQAENSIYDMPVTKDGLALFLNQKAAVLFYKGDISAAIDILKKSIQAWDHPDNEAHNLLPQMQK